jgi:MFS family permease
VDHSTANSGCEPNWNEINTRRSWITVWLLTAAYAISLLDRQILYLLIEPIKADLHLTDFEFSLIAGFSFTLLYSLLGVPFGWLADRYSRKLLITIGISGWSMMTMLCGTANSFWMLFLSRMGVGIGEATLAPSAYSMMSDLFPPKKLATPVAVFMTGAYFGSGIAMLAGGGVIAAVAVSGPVSLPLIGKVSAWQLAFIIVSLPGLLIALAMGALKEPARQALARDEPKAGLFVFLKSRTTPMIGMISAFSLYSSVPVAFMVWIPAILIRSHGWGAASVGLTYGLIMLTCAPLGMYCSGKIADHFTSRGCRDAALRISTVAVVLATPIAGIVPVLSNSTLVVILLAPMSFLLGFPSGLSNSTLGRITPNRLRGRIIALYTAVGTLLASGLGPSIVAAISDFALKSPGSIGPALSIFALIGLPLSAIAFHFLGGSYARALATAERQTPNLKES